MDTSAGKQACSRKRSVLTTAPLLTKHTSASAEHNTPRVSTLNVGATTHAVQQHGRVPVALTCPGQYPHAVIHTTHDMACTCHTVTRSKPYSACHVQKCSLARRRWHKASYRATATVYLAAPCVIPQNTSAALVFRSPQFVGHVLQQARLAVLRLPAGGRFQHQALGGARPQCDSDITSAVGDVLECAVPTLTNKQDRHMLVQDQRNVCVAQCGIRALVDRGTRI